MINRLLVRFTDISIERDYRVDQFPQDRRQSVVGVFIFILPIVLFIFTDLSLFGSGNTFLELIVVRLLLFVISLLLILSLIKMKRSVFMDYAILLWLFGICGITVFVNMTRPPDYIGHFYIDIMLIISIYAIFNNRFEFQCLPAVLFTGMNLYLLLDVKTALPEMYRNVIIISHVLANVVGIFIAWNLQVKRRRQYLALVNEKIAVEKLREAASSIRVLRGLLPICARCKSIRDDKGYWKKLEEYIQYNSEATFTHGICEACEKMIYSGTESGPHGDDEAAGPDVSVNTMRTKY